MKAKKTALSSKLKFWSLRPNFMSSETFKHLPKPKRHHFVVSGAVVVVVGLGGAALLHDRTMPGVQLASVSASSKTRDQLKSLVQAEQKAMKVKFTYKNDPTVATAKDLGVSVDVDKTVDNAMHARRRGNLWQNLAIWKSQNVPLVTSVDFGQFKDYTAKHFPSIMVNAKDAHLVYNGNSQQFDITDGTPGRGFDTDKFKNLLPELAANPQTMTLAVSSAPVQPLIQKSAVTDLQKQMNQRIHQSITFAYQGSVRYTATPSDIAQWVNFTPDPHDGKVSATYDKAKIKQYLEQKVGPSIASPPVDQKVVKDPHSDKQVVLQQGKNGFSVKDLAGVTAQVTSALTGNKPLSAQLAVTETPFKTVALTGYNKWVEVDLTKQTATLYVNASAQQTFTIASGVADHATEVGTFHVWYKTPEQTMTGGQKASGDYYYLPHVKWVSYFDNEEAFHTAYWLSPGEFGRPQSHGCINMTEADAKTMYDFAGIGTTVVVHY